MTWPPTAWPPTQARMVPPPPSAFWRPGMLPGGNGKVVGENFWTGFGSPEEVLEWFLSDPPHRANILSERYREIGIGFARDSEGRIYYVLDFGARPNVLPIFINDGAATTASPQVAIRLTNEEAYPQGEGSAYMGRAVEIRISNTPDFGNAAWQLWEPLIPWTLPSEPGEHWVYIQFRDAAGRVAGSADSILLVPGLGTPTMPAATSAAPPTPTAAPVPTPALPPAPSPTSGPTVLPTPVSAPSPAPTALPSPAALPVSPTPFSIPTPFATVRTFFPTWTPLPPLTAEEEREARPPLGLLFALQGLAVLLGVYLALRRRSA
ncbi:MAG: hypothetical protein D6793_05075 [Thermoflexia bacterium]|nr:MAG: hypothetical protein D6793_05075 [Thermoflexia bacterium]